MHIHTHVTVEVVGNCSLTYLLVFCNRKLTFEFTELQVKKGKINKETVQI